MSDKPESVIYISSTDIFKGFVIMVVVLLLIAVVVISNQVGKSSAWKEIEDYCRTSDLFTMPDKEGLFSCYRADKKVE